jgi:ABC-2 type transport system permease protein
VTTLDIAPAVPRRPTSRGASTVRTTFATDTSIVLERELRPMLANPFSLTISLVQPLVFLGLFGPLLTRVSGVDTATALQWFVPGIVVMSALVATSMTGANLQAEMQSGAHERLLVAPLRRSSLLVGRALKEIVPVVAQSLIIVAVAAPFGFRLEPVGIAVGLAILGVFGVGMGALSYSLAIAAKGEDWVFWSVQQTLMFPLLLLAGILLPVEDGPGWIRFLSDLNPLTYVVQAERVLFDGDLASAAVGKGAAAAALTCALGLLVGVRAMRSGTAD